MTRDKNPSFPVPFVSRCIVFLIAFSILFVTNPLELQAATCRAITPTGSGARTGADWNNAYAGLPSTLVRGDTYFLADGTYPPYIFNTPDSGTTRVTIKKAIGSDHCTDTGWNFATMGSAQAVFSSGGYGEISIQSDYLTIDGQSRTSPTSGHGIKVDGTSTVGTFAWHVHASGVTGLTLRYIEVEGGGDSKTDTLPDTLFRAFGCIDTLIEYSYFHHSSVTGFQTGACGNFTLQYSVIDHTASSPVNHGEAWADVANSVDGGSHNVTIRYNQFRDAEGTGFIVSLNASSIGNVDTWDIYGNIFSYTPGNPTARQGVGNGVIACINGNHCTNWTIVNNTFANIGGNGATGNAAIGWFEGSTGTPIIENNLWYNNQLNVNFTLNGGSTEDYNTFLNYAGSGGSGAHDVKQANGAASPFVDNANENYHLTAATAAGVNLSSPYNIDPDGRTRGVSGAWDRGAYEFVGSAQVPIPPANLSVR